MNKEYYTRENMLEWLKKYYSANEYEVDTYCDTYLPARVPLHCKKEKYLFSWGKIPGDDSEQLQKLLKEDFGISWAKNADISKTEDDKTIIVSADENSVELTLHEKNDAVTLRINGQRANNFPVRKEKGELTIYKTDELVIEITTDKIISRDGFFPPLTISGLVILEASPVRFYQYYFPKAKIFLAYSDYVEEDVEFNEFKKVCVKRGIGLLKTSKKEVVQVVESRPLFDEICNQLVNNKKKQEDIEDIIGNYLENYLHYLVYYPDPVYKRRAITGRTEGDISFILIDKLYELKNITYKEKLIKLASEYRQEDRDDYQIALETITELWLEICKLEYPEIQRQLEDILLRNSEYRDHFLHQFQVFLLGTCIIDNLYSNKEKCLTEFSSLYKCPIEKAWLISSTYHDFNYSIQQYDFWIKEFITQSLNTTGTGNLSPLKLDAAFIRENFLLKTKEICKALDLEMNHIVMNFFYEQAVNRNTRNHGLLSALSLLKLCENTQSKQIDHSALVQAAVAIALHDWNIWKYFSGIGEKDDNEWSKKFAKKKFLKNLEFKSYPLAFLLIFCDTIQEWGRVGRDYKEAEPRLEDIIIYFSKESKIEVGLSVKDDSSYDEKVKEIQRVKKFIKDPRFKIELESRKGKQKTQIAMTGN